MYEIYHGNVKVIIPKSLGVTAMSQGEELAYCEQCGEEQPIRKTVPWQPDLCATCSAELEKPA